MNKRLILTLIISAALILPSNAEYTEGFVGDVDFTGEAFFKTPEQVTNTTTNNDDAGVQSNEKSSKQKGTIPPIKKLRLKMQARRAQKEMLRNELAPTMQDAEYQGEIETSEYASKEIEEDFDDMDIEVSERNLEQTTTKKGLFGRNKKVQKEEDDAGIILDCEQVDYDNENYLVFATGNVNVEFVKQGTVVKADVITYDRMNNTIKAEGNVRIIKNGYVTTGDYIFVDMNEENAIVENPMTESPSIKIVSKKATMQGDKLTQENGVLTVEGEHRIEFDSGRRAPRLSTMLLPEDDELENSKKNTYGLKAREIKYKQKGELETVAIKRGKIYSSNGRTILKFPAIKFYTNKNHDYFETNFWEIGTYRGLGLYTGPGWVFEMPKGSVLKAMPVLNYKSGAGVGAILRYSSGTNLTTAAYGSAAKRFFVYGTQRLDDNLLMQYSVNSYMDEWFLGRRRPKYGISLVYNNQYSSNDFLIKGRESTFRHRLEAGYFQNLDFDNNFERIRAGNIGTMRLRYMAMAQQNLFKYEDKEKLKAFKLSLSSQLSTALYGTGDTQVVARTGPVMHTQYKRWMQDIAYYFAATHDESPMPAYDAYRYGGQTLYIKEYLRLCRWLTVSWFAAMNFTNDSYNGRTFQENAFYFSVGPDEFKFHLGYDFERETLRAGFEMMMDAKGTEVQYDKLEIKQDKKAKKEPKIVEQKPNAYAAPTEPKVLQRAVVEDVKVLEDVI